MANNINTGLLIRVVLTLACASFASACSGDDEDTATNAVEADGGTTDAARDDDAPRAGAAGRDARMVAEAAGSRAAPEAGSAGADRPMPDEATTAGAGGGAPDAADGGSGVAVSGVVVDASNSDAKRNFDHTQYPALAGVKICVYERPDVPCATTDSDGRYMLGRLPETLDVYLTYEKESFASVLFRPVPETGREMPAIFMMSTDSRDALAMAGGIAPDAATGFIHFGANLLESRGTMFHQKFGTAEIYYLRAYRLSVAPAPKAGPVYVSSHWAPDVRLTESSAAGWGIIQAVPGDYTLSFEHPSLTCPTATAKVVKGFITTYVGVVCSVADVDMDAGI